MFSACWLSEAAPPRARGCAGGSASFSIPCFRRCRSARWPLIEALPPEARLLITTGFLGGLTTFSTFSGEAATLLGRQQLGWTAALVGAHVVGSILMTFAGIGSMRLILR